MDHGDLPEVPEAAGGGVSTLTVEDVTEAMKDVVDPELGINVVDLGLVYDVHLDEESNVVLDMTLTSAACPLTDVIMDQTNSALEGLAKDVAINWVWMPPWGPDKITPDGRESCARSASTSERCQPPYRSKSDARQPMGGSKVSSRSLPLATRSSGQVPVPSR